MPEAIPRHIVETTEVAAGVSRIRRRKASVVVAIDQICQGERDECALRDTARSDETPKGWRLIRSVMSERGLERLHAQGQVLANSAWPIESQDSTRLEAYRAGERIASRQVA
jgi:hypothetical protein